MLFVCFFVLFEKPNQQRPNDIVSILVLSEVRSVGCSVSRGCHRSVRDWRIGGSFLHFAIFGAVPMVLEDFFTP